MANLAELIWLKEYGEASRLADEISKMLSECGSLPPSEPATQRHLSSMIRRMRILSARLGNLETDLTSIPRKSRFSLLRKFTSDKEMRKRQEMLSNLRAREQQMASALADIMPEDLAGSSNEVKTGRVCFDQARGFAFAAVLDNQRIVSVQTQIMRKQDEVLDRLEEAALTTKQIALAMNEELNLHTRLTVSIYLLFLI
ncbi:syntaxin-52-like protein [Carex littledalei]|uniref:Syntaxin-52-like protein n=1 Tax=Carex littledalei TaxID=544730 RepID=A0A833VKN5_9POAL|nr:syntaxin-52-like protein [Carex littledalei]